MKDFSGIIDQVLHSVIIPLLPLYVCGNFIDMTKSGKTTPFWASCGRCSWWSSSCIWSASSCSSALQVL